MEEGKEVKGSPGSDERQWLKQFQGGDANFVPGLDATQMLSQPITVGDLGAVHFGAN
jgi:hypothetical protein